MMKLNPASTFSGQGQIETFSSDKTIAGVRYRKEDKPNSGAYC